MHGLETIVERNRNAASPQLYRINRPSVGSSDFMATHIATGKVAFYGSKRECREWIERNGHDGDV